MADYPSFSKAILRGWWKLLSSAILTTIGFYALVADKSKAWLITATLIVADLLFFWAAYEAWRDERNGRIEAESRIDTGRAHLALELSREEIHNWDVPRTQYFVLHASKFLREIRFDPIESRKGLKIWLDGVSSLAPAQRVPVGFRVGENGEYPGIVGHLVNFFEGGSSDIDQPPYSIKAHFLDGTIKRTEEYVIEGHPLPNGGVQVKIVPGGKGF